MPLEFTMSDIAASDHGIKVCLYARSGIGKTMQAAVCPQPLILAAEPGMLSLAPKNIERVFGVGNPRVTYRIPTIKINTVDDLVDIHQWLQFSNEAKSFSTVYVDSVTEIAEVVLSNAKLFAKDGRAAYGDLAEKMTLTLKALRNIVGKHVVFVAKQGNYTDDVSKVVMYGPMMPGKQLTQGMPYLFDEVFRLGVAKTNEGQDYRFIQTQPDLQYEAKDRSGVLAPVEPPDMGLIFDKILARKST